MNELDVTRAKIIGVLIRDARLQAGRSAVDCANVLGISKENFIHAEKGKHVLSLPDMEVLAMYLKVPLVHFWGTQTIDNPQRTSYQDLLELRQQVIGGQLRRARVEAGRSQEDVAGQIKSSIEEIEAYEKGIKPIPLLHLERMGKYLGVSLDFFIDTTRGPLAEHEAEQKILKRFYDLPSDLRAFVAEPINRSYLETAMNLSEMDVHRLRRIAESILDITF